MYVFLGTMLGLIFVFLYIMVNLACIGYFWRQRRDEFNYIKHLLVPVLGVVAMIPAGLAVIGGVTIPSLDVTLDPYKNALRFAAPIVGIWMLIGVVLYFFLRARSPESLERMGDVYGGEAPSPSSRRGGSHPSVPRRSCPPGVPDRARMASRAEGASGSTRRYTRTR